MSIISNISEYIRDFLENHSLGLCALILIAFPAVLFFQTTAYDFVWDDKPIYINESVYPKDNAFEHFSDYWVPRQDKMYIPVTQSVWGIALTVDKPVRDTQGELKYDPVIFHVLNYIVHIFNCLLVLVILNLLLENAWAALAGALVFAVHPLQVEPVAWISELRGLLSAFFGFIAIWNFILFRKNEKKANYYYVFVALLLSMLSKPSAVVFPFIIFFVDFIGLGSKLMKSLKSSLVFIIISIPFILISMYSESNSAINFEASWQERPFIFFDNLAFYLYKLILPVNLAPTYGRTTEIASAHWAYQYLWAIPLVLIGLMLWKRKKSGRFALALIIFVMGFITVSGIVPFYYQYWSNVADRYVYISMLGAGLAFAYFVSILNSPKLASLITLVLAGAMGFLSWLQLPAWQNDEALWTDVIEKYPGRSAHAYTGRGLIFAGQNIFQQALSDFDNAVKIDSAYPEGFINRGNLYFDNGKFPEAIENYTLSLKYDKLNKGKAFYNRAMASERAGDFKNAVADYSNAIKLNPPELYIYYSGRGIAYANLSSTDIRYLDSAIFDFKRALELNPNDRASYDNLTRANNIKMQYIEMQKAMQDSIRNENQD